MDSNHLVGNESSLAVGQDILMNDNMCAKTFLDELSFAQLSQLFEQVVAIVRDDSKKDNDTSSSSSSANKDASSSLVLTTNDKLLLYGWYKHATTTTTTQPPPVWNVAAHAKYQAIEACRRDGLTQREAMQRYIAWWCADAPQQQHSIGQRVQALLMQQASAVKKTVTTRTNEKDVSRKEDVVGKEHSTVTDSTQAFSQSTTSKRTMMIPRGQLDIGYRDLWYAAWQSCLFSRYGSSGSRHLLYQERIANLFGRTEQQQQQQQLNVVVGLSVRSLLDLWLRVQRYQAGSQVVVTPPITVPAVLRVFEYHKITVVPIDLPTADASSRPLVAVDCGSVERAIEQDNGKVVAILVVNVFGMMTATDEEMQRLRILADNHDILLMEDCAQVYGGGGVGTSSADNNNNSSNSAATTCVGAAASAYAHVSLFSFGLIKTGTSLGCGVAVVRGKPVLAKSMQRFQTACYPHQPVSRYRVQIVKAMLLRVIADSPLLYGCIMTMCEQGLGWDFDQLATGLLRSFGNTDDDDNGNGPRSKMGGIRYQPSTAMLAVLYRRLIQHRTVSSTVCVRRERSHRFSKIFVSNHPVLSIPRYHDHPSHAYWLYPVLSTNPSALCMYLKSFGFDATRGASQLMCIGKEECPKARELMEQLVYLPLSSPALTVTNLTQLERALSAYSTIDPDLPLDASLYSTTSGKSSWEERLPRTTLLLACTSLMLPFAVPVVKIVVFLASVLAFAAILLFLALQALRMSIASYYINSSDAFAKYNYMLDEANDGGPADESRVNNDPCNKFRLDSTMKVLKLPNSTTNRPRSVVLTGATGFIGSTLLYDLLKSRGSLALKCIYIVCRAKRGESPGSRVDNLLSKPMFSFLSRADRDSLVRVLEGDTTLPDLGISDSELDGIRQDPSITHIFHCAASVGFTQSLSEAATANVTSALHAQRLVSRLSNKQAQFVHISTAFVHGRLTGTQDDPLPEQLHSLAPYDAHEIYRSMCGTQYYASKAMADLGFPNTYTFSKCVAEHLLREGDVCTVIIRPSIVGPALEMPFPGWSGSKPSTIVAAACLYFAYQWNLWSFGCHKVPCIPVDVLCRFIVSKTVRYPASNQNDVSSTGNDDEISSSDEDYEKISKSCIQTFASSDSDQAEGVAGHRIHTAAWNTSSNADTQFTWLDYASTITQTGAVMGYFSRTTAYVGLLMAVRLLPSASLSYEQFKNLHISLVQAPFSLLMKFQRALGLKTFALEKLQPYLDLPLLFFPFMNNTFHFTSELVAPVELRGQHYLFRCTSAALRFLSKRDGSRYCNRKAWFLLHNNHRSDGKGFLWAFMQPKGDAITRFAAALLSYILPLCFKNITVDVDALSKVSRDRQWLDGKRRIVLAPTHRSFFDFLLLSYALFAVPELQIDLPFIVAADDFEKLPVIGYVARLLGAFFVARGRGQNDPVLADVIAKLPAQCSIELFIEGTRSRDRRFVQPKTGFIRCLQNIGKDFTVVPITMSYEAIPEQDVLSREAAGGKPSGLVSAGLFSWLLDAVAGKLPRGRVHLSASLPAHLKNDSKRSPRILVDHVQIQQKERLFVSRYHVLALATALKLEEKSVSDALHNIRCNFWPDTGTSDIPPIPVDKEEVWTVALQVGPWLSPLFFDTRPQWSKWLFRLCNENVSDGVIKQPSVEMLCRALEEQFDLAGQHVRRAISQLKGKGFVSCGVDHIVQIARNYGNVPTILLRASAEMTLPELQALRKSQNPVPVADVVQTRVVSSLRSGEVLGHWGFSDSFLTVEVDRNRDPYVTMKGHRYSLADKRLFRIIPFIEQELGVSVDLMREFRGECWSQCSSSTSGLSAKDIGLLQMCVSKVSFDHLDRLRSGTGHSQDDVFEVRQGSPIRVPDAVVWPNSESEVQAIITMATKQKWCLIPVGGGTNVSQATRCPSMEVESRPIIAVDMKDMNRIILLDEENGTVHVGAGITGRHLIAEMARRGYTIGHEPDSYEFSTLGGWIATKASGMKRNKYGNIEDIVRAVRVAGPNGILEHGSADSPVWGRESAGLDLCSVMLGSEGCLGIITSAVIRIWHVARVRDYDSMLLPDFEQGLNFVRDVSKRCGKAAASVRLLDNAHFRLGRALQSEDQSLLGLVRRSLGEVLLRWSGSFDERQVVCATILYEGDEQEVQGQKRLLRRLARHHGGLSLGAHVGKIGYDMTFSIAYLRDFALTYRILGESFESFVPWSKAKDLVQATKNRIHKEHSSRCLPGRAFVGCRITQLYHEGVCLYFYLSMSFDNVENPSIVFGHIEKAAREEILEHGGSLSHHHGVGKIRASYLSRIDSTPWQESKLAIKRVLDPDNVFGARNGSFASYAALSSGET